MWNKTLYLLSFGLEGETTCGFISLFSNGAVCGALVGCVVGFKSLPEDLLQFPHRDWLDKQVDNFLETIGLKEQ